MRGALLAALCFGLAGPAVGTLLYAAWGAMASDAPTSVGATLLGGLWLLPFGYLLGLVPAAVTGLAVGFLGRDLRAPAFVALATAVGAAAMALVGLFGGSEVEFTEGVLNLAIMGGVAGGVSGALLRVLLHRR
jgi:hypothetical protein